MQGFWTNLCFSNFWSLTSVRGYQAHGILIANTSVTNNYTSVTNSCI